MCDLSTAVAWAQIISSGVGVVGVPVLIWYAWEAARLRRISQKQLDATGSPVVFFDNPIRAIEPGWENIDIVNGGGGPALNVEYRIGDQGDTWVTIPALMSGERRQISHDIGHMINEAGRNRQMNSSIYVRCRGWSGERYESRAMLESSDGITFHLKVQRPDNDL